MSKEAIVIPHHLQLYIDQCINDEELKALNAIPIKIFDFIVNFRNYYDFEKREFKDFQGRRINLKDIRTLSGSEISQFKQSVEEAFNQVFPSQPSKFMTHARPEATTQPHYEHALLIEFIRRSRKPERMASIALTLILPTSAIDEMSIAPNPAVEEISALDIPSSRSTETDVKSMPKNSSAENIAALNISASIKPANDKINLHKKVKENRKPQTSISPTVLAADSSLNDAELIAFLKEVRKQQPVPLQKLSMSSPPQNQSKVAHLIRSILPSRSTTALDNSASQINEETPLLQKPRTFRTP